MTKKIFSLVILLINLICLAEEASPLEIGDIEIFGQAEGFRDSLQAAQADSASLNYLDLDIFSYEPGKVNAAAPAQIELAPEKNQAYLRLSGGMYSLWEARFMLIPHDYGLGQISGEYEHSKYQSDYESNEFYLQWQPEIREFNPSVNWEYHDHKFDGGKTGLHSFGFDSGRLRYSGDKLGEIEINPEFCYSILQQNYSIQEHEKSEFSGNVLSSWQKDFFQAKLAIGWQYKQMQTALEIERENIGLDKLAIWLAADKEHLYPSIKFSQAFSLGRNFSFIWQNNPYITQRNIKALIRDNHNLTGWKQQKQSKYLINHTVAVQYQAGFFAALSINNRYVKDRLVCDDIFNYINCICGFYEADYPDMWEHELGGKLNWGWQNFELKNRFSLTLYSQDIIFAPSLQLESRLCYFYNPQLSVMLGLYGQTGRKQAVTINSSEMADIWDLDLCIDYRFKEKLNLFIKLDNLLDKENQRYHLSGKERFSLGAGVEYLY